MTVETIVQIWITLFGGASIWLLGRHESWKKWGYLLGLISQPAWIYTAYTNEQYGMLIVSLWYAYSWGQGVYFHIWRVRGKNES